MSGTGVAARLQSRADCDVISAEIAQAQTMRITGMPIFILQADTRSSVLKRQRRWQTPFSIAGLQMEKGA